MSTGQPPERPPEGIAWPEVWAWAGDRLTVAGRGVVLFGLALAGLVQLGLLLGILIGPIALDVRTANHRGHQDVILLVSVGGLVVWLVAAPLVLRWMRSLAGLTRRVIARWTRVAIAEPYLPHPRTAGRRGLHRRLTWLLTDPATWRDLLWITVNGLVGWIWALLPAAVLVLGLLGIIAPYSGGLTRFLAIGAAAAVTWASPNLLRGYGYFARSLLAPTREAELTLKVQHLAQTRTEAIDTGAAEILLDQASVVVAGGDENMTRQPFLDYGKGEPHLAGELLKLSAGIDIVHVPYHGSAPELVDLIAGHVQVAFEPIQSCLGYIKAGTLRALAVSTAARAPALPDVPTLGEFIPGFEARTWQGLGAPKHLPVEIADRLNKEVVAALAEPALQARLADLGIAPMPMTPAQCQTFITAEVEKWAKVIKFASIKPE